MRVVSAIMRSLPDFFWLLQNLDSEVAIEPSLRFEGGDVNEVLTVSMIQETRY